MSATQKLIDGTIPAEYYDVPLRALNHQTRQEICLYLDPNLITGMLPTEQLLSICCYLNFSLVTGKYKSSTSDRQ